MTEIPNRPPTLEELAHSKLLSYVAYQFPQYVIGQMHLLIAAYLEAVERGDITRLMIWAPPRHGKTAQVGEYFPAWYLGRNPDHHIIYTTYNQERGNDVGRRVRDQAISENFQRIFPNCNVLKDSKAISHFSTMQKGEYFNVGMGGAIVGRGANCLPAETILSVEIDGVKKELDIETLYLLQYHQEIKVLSFDHNTNNPVYKRIVAARRLMANELYEITTNSGNKIRATGDHRFFISGCGYTYAKALRRGDRLTTCEIQKQQDMCKLWKAKEWERPFLQGMLQQPTKCGYRNNLCLVWQKNNKKSIRNTKSDKKRAHRSLLLIRMFKSASCNKKQAQVCNMWQSSREEDTKILLRRMPENSTGITETIKNTMPTMFENVSAFEHTNSILLTRMCKQSTFRKNDWRREFPLQKWGKLFGLVQRNEAFYYNSGYGRMHNMSCPNGINRDKKKGAYTTNKEQTNYSSYRQQPNKQHSRKFNIAMHKMSCNTPQIQHDAISTIKRISTNSIPVYDIQVEGTSNCFTNKILTHNCLIIDDPIKDRQEAESKTARKNVQNWYQAVAYTRVMPGGKIVVINTRWHCFSEDTEILTTDGWIAAKDINKEHLFITQNGIEPIERMESKHFDGPMYEFTMYGTPKKLKVTGNHKILTADGWKYAEQLTKDDWLIVPNINECGIPIFDVSTGKRIVGNQLQLRVKKIEVSQYKGLIYDFETKSHIVTAAGVVVHNSNDLSGYLMEEHAHENWAILDLKAIAEPGDILKRKEGAALWPEFRDIEQLDIIKTALGPREWNAQFQQRPTALGGGRVKFEWINHYEQLPKPDEIQRIVASWDTAYKPEQINDPTACTIWIITATGYYLIDVRNKRLEFPDLVKEIHLVHEIHHPSAHLIEGRATGQSLIQELKRSTRIPTVEISTKNINNEIRFDAITTLFESGKIWFPKQAHWLSETEDQICSFPTAPHDDIADSVSQFLNWVNKPRYVSRPPSKLYWK